MWVQCITDVFSYTGAERAAIPVWARFYTDGCFGYTDTCGTVVIPLIYDYADSFSNGFAVVGKGEKNDRRFGLIDRQGCEVVPCIYADVAGFSSGLARVQEGRIPSAAMGMSIRWDRS